MPGKGQLLYAADFSNRESVADWVMEGPGALTFEDGWMQMFSPEEAMHHVFWCPAEFPESFLAEWEVQNLKPEAGLCIVFFAAKGEKGEELFHPSLPERDGDFKQYTHGQLINYHISYYANHPTFEPGSGIANLRKNHGFHLVQEGEVGIPPDSTQIHRISLVKKKGQIQMFVDDSKIIEWTDDGETHGPVYAGGKIGFRQMKWTRFQYRKLKVWSLQD